MYKIIALDMDGTLLNEKKEITPKTKEALQKAKDKGIKIVLASGRPIEGLYKYLHELDLVQDGQYVLSYNGCLVQETKSKKIICEMGLKGSDLSYTYEIAKKLNVNIHAFSATRGLITPKMNTYTKYEADVNGIEASVVSFEDLDPSEDIIKIMFIDEPEILEEAIKKIPKELYEKYTVVRSAPFFLEVINKESNKGVGLKALADSLGVKEEEVIACGDANNDLEMLEYAGLGVAMENATDDVKEIANYQTKSNNEDGIAEVVNKFIL